ncbi:chemocyanin-like [Oryza brachyantha]|uniref:Plantacyanin n=1 Tax=Oryza brachyantha TaxID=4533 RepID=J3LBG6_ORYBR|nr:chemocyanin-like [Oryza brachyantha]
MARRSATVLALCCAAAIAVPAAVVHGNEWTVGDDKGWTFGVAGWENGKRIRPGDVLVFKYDGKIHNVVEVDRAGYDGCKVTGPSKVRSSGDDRVELAGGEAFFICGVGDHCSEGMKIAVTTA